MVIFIPFTVQLLTSHSCPSSKKRHNPDWKKDNPSCKPLFQRYSQIFFPDLFAVFPPNEEKRNEKNNLKCCADQKFHFLITFLVLKFIKHP